eukprot:COSAG02_NODE_134_length_34593_cov_43.594886_26_plen_1236_part_00
MLRSAATAAASVAAFGVCCATASSMEPTATAAAPEAPSEPSVAVERAASESSEQPAAKKPKKSQGKRRSGQRKPVELTDEQQRRKREWEERQKDGSGKRSRRSKKEEKEHRAAQKAAAEQAKAAAAPPRTIPCKYCQELFSSRTQVFKHLRKGGTACTRLAIADGLVVSDKDKVQRTVLVVGVCADGSLKDGDVAAALRKAVAAGGAMPQGAEEDNTVSAAVPLGSDEHAGCTVVSLNTPKLRCDDDAYVLELNAVLPPAVRIIAAGSTLPEFNASNRCDKIVYEVMVPLPLLLEDVGDLHRGFRSTRFSRKRIADMWEVKPGKDAASHTDRQLLFTPGSDGAFELQDGCYIEWTQQRDQFIAPHHARVALQCADGSGWLVSKKDIFATNAVAPAPTESDQTRQYDVNWLHPFAENYRWLRIDADSFEIQGDVENAQLLREIAGGSCLRVSAVGLWFERPSGWSGPEFTLGHYRVEIPLAGGPRDARSRTRLDINSALKQALNAFQGSHSFHNFTPGSKSSFATAASQTVWKTTCAGNLLFAPRQSDDSPESTGTGDDHCGDGTGGKCGNGGGQEFVRLRFEGRHFLPGQAAAMASLAVLSVRLSEKVSPELLAASLEPSCILSGLQPLPASLVYVAEAHYVKYETTTQTVIWPRDRDIPNGFNSARHELDVRTGRAVVQGCIASQEVLANSAGKMWQAQADDVADQLCQQYTLYKQTQQVHGSVSSVDGAMQTVVPAAYEKVLGMLRAIKPEQWPRTSNARRERIESRSTADGGDSADDKPAGESFSLGAMPVGRGLRQPQANADFSDLLEACLDLEEAIMPERPPSSTVVINRNAQFKPHTDSGAGAGQSCSLIVGLGEYTGGGLVVEGKVHHIAYNPVEFDGWKQVHWTLPFEGERYSIVWFTPKGCEEMVRSRKREATLPCNFPVWKSEEASLLGDGGSIVLQNGCATGQHMPILGFGTHTLKGDAAKSACACALGAGYELIDTASVYQNEKEVGTALRESGVQRGALFLTSKLKPHDQGYAPARLAFERTRATLAVEYLDLFLIHWPGTAKTPLTADANAVNRHESWRALQELQASGRIHAIGVSNFEISHLEALRLAPTTTVKPAVNQIELHPRLYIAQKPLLDYCASHGIVVQAYASLGSGSLLADPDVMAVGRRTGLSEAAVLLLWAVGHGFAVIPRSTDPSRIAANRAAVEQARSAPVNHFACLGSSLATHSDNVAFCQCVGVRHY